MNANQFNSCVDSLSDGLYRFVLGILHDVEGAKDVVQESFTRLWEHRKSVERVKGKSFLFKIAYNLSISQLRTTKRRYNVGSEALLMIESAQGGGYDNEAEILWRELDRLPAMSRSLIMLCDWEGYSYAEISEIMNLSEGQVKIGLYRSRQVLKRRLKIYLDER